MTPRDEAAPRAEFARRGRLRLLDPEPSPKGSD